MAQYDGSIRINTKIDSKEASVQLRTLENRIVKTADKIAGLRSKMDALKDVQIPTEEYAEVQKQIASTEKKLADLQAKQQKFLDTGGKTSSSAYKKMQYDIDEMKSSLPYLNGELQELVESGKAFILGENSQKFADLSQQLRYAENDLSVLVQKEEEARAKTGDVKASYVSLGESIKQAFKTMGKGLIDIPIAAVKKGIAGLKAAFTGLGNIARKAMSGIASIIRKAATSMLSFGKSTKSTTGFMQGGLKSIIKYGLGINSIYAIVNKLRTGIKEGFSNMANEIDSFGSHVNGLKASFATLKNSFAAAFRPLVEMAIPYIQKTIDAIASLMNIIGQFTAAITGQKTYTKAIKQTTAAIEDENKAQNKQLSGLDKLNNLSSGSGGGDSGGGGNMFEEQVPIDSGILSMYQNLKDLIESEDWEGLGAYIADALNRGLQKVYDIISWENVGPRVTAFIDAFTSTFNSLVDNLDWDLLGRTIGAGINTITNALYLLITGIDWVNLGKKLAEGLNGLANEINAERLGNLIGEKFMVLPRILLGFVSKLNWKEVGEKIGNTLNGMVESIKLSEIGSFLGRALTGALESAISFAKTFEWEKLGDNIASGINSFFEDFNFEDLATALNLFVDGLISSISTALEGITWDDIFSKIGDFLGNLELDTVAVLIGAFAITHGGVPLTYNIIKKMLMSAMGANVQTGMLKIGLIVGVTILAVELMENARPKLREFGLKISEAITGETVNVDLLNNLVKGSSFDLDMSVMDMIKHWWDSLITGSLLTDEDRGLMQKVLDHYFGEGTFDISTYLDFGASFQKVRENWDNYVIPFVEQVFGCGENISSGLLNGISGGFGSIGTWLNEHIFQPFIAGFKSLFGIHSPSTVMEEQGTYIMEGLLEGINSLVDSVKEIWENMKATVIEIWNKVRDGITDTISNIKTAVTSKLNEIKNTWNTIWNTVKSSVSQIWNSIKQTISSVITSIKTTIANVLSSIRNTWNNIWTGLKTTVISIFDGIWSGIKGVINRILGGIESMVNGVIDGVNGMISALNSIHFSVPSWVPGLGGKSFGIDLNPLSNVSIPRLATGTVVPPNKEFLAVLGDNKNEPEIVSPISSMKQAVLEAIQEAGGLRWSNGEINLHLTVECEGIQLLKLIQKLDLEQYNRTGRPSFQM